MKLENNLWDAMHTVTNIDVEILMHTEIFILMKVAFFRRDLTIQFNHKNTSKQNKTGIWIKLTKKLVIIANNVITDN